MRHGAFERRDSLHLCRVDDGRRAAPRVSFLIVVYTRIVGSPVTNKTKAAGGVRRVDGRAMTPGRGSRVGDGRRLRSRRDGTTVARRGGE